MADAKLLIRVVTQFGSESCGGATMRGRPLHYAAIIGGIKFLWVVPNGKQRMFVTLTLWHRVPFQVLVLKRSGGVNHACMLEKWGGGGGRGGGGELSNLCSLQNFFFVVVCVGGGGSFEL